MATAKVNSVSRNVEAGYYGICTNNFRIGREYESVLSSASQGSCHAKMTMYWKKAKILVIEKGPRRRDIHCGKEGHLKRIVGLQTRSATTTAGKLVLHKLCPPIIFNLMPKVKHC